MRVVLVLASPEDIAVLEAQVAFHLAAGVDLVLVPAGVLDSSSDKLERFVESGVLKEVPAGGTPEEQLRTVGRVSYEQHGADWVISARAGEFWWPHARSLKDVLAPVPPRYGVVQGLLRTLLPASGSGAGVTWMERTVRPTLLPGRIDAGAARLELLRPAYRAHAALDLAVEGGGRGTGQSLRSWFPIEVMSLAPSEETPEPREVERLLAEGSLVTDTRVSEALRLLAAGSSITFSVPNVVEDAAYAVECAAVGDVDLSLLDQEIRRLEARIAWLESRPSQRLRRLAHFRRR